MPGPDEDQVRADQVGADQPGDGQERQPTLIDPARAFTERLPAVGHGPDAAGPDMAAQPATAGTVIADRYRLDRVLGRGATAVVWAAADERLDRDVALKLLRPEHLEGGDVADRFRREAMVAARLSHPGIVHVLDADVTGQGGFIAMQLLGGGSLADRLDTLPWAPEAVAQLGIGVLDALAVAHDAGVVHRDIKPGNILFAAPDDDVPVLTDFGVAKVLLAEQAQRTATGVVLGTAAYLAPEQALGEDLDARADLYALGCVLFQLATGRQPFGGDSPIQVASARIGRQVRPHDVDPSLPAWLDEVVAVALAPTREARYADAEAMAEALRAGLAGRPLPGAPAERPARVTPAAPSAEAGVISHTETGPRPTRPSPQPAVDRTPPQPTPVPSPARKGRFARAGGLPVIAAICLVLAVAVLAPAGVLGGDDPDEGEVAADGTEAPAPADGGELVAAAGARGFDPQGDGSEHDDDAPLVLDGDPATAWRSEGYDSAAFGNLKDGVGVVVELSGPTALSAVRVLGLGAPAEIRVAGTSPSSLEDTTLVATVDAGDHEVDLGEAGEVGAVVVWVTGPLPTDGGRHRASVGEVQLVR